MSDSEEYTSSLESEEEGDGLLDTEVSAADLRGEGIVLVVDSDSLDLK